MTDPTDTRTTPPAPVDELLDEQLDAVAGGGFIDLSAT